MGCTIFPANTHDFQLYAPTIEAFGIPRTEEEPAIISADAAHDARGIRRYNRKHGIRSKVLVNRRNRKHPKWGGAIKFNLEVYKKHTVVERFFIRVEIFKKIVPRYERYERSFMGPVHLACIVMIRRVLG